MLKRTLEAVPEDVLYQSNAVSRSIHDMPVAARRLMWAGIAVIKLRDTEIPTVEMTIASVIKALGLTDGSDTYAALRSAALDLMRHVIKIETPRGWMLRHWVDQADYDRETDTLTLRFSEEIRPYILGMRSTYTLLALGDIGRLGGKYSTRIFELVMSNRGFAGHADNAPGTWFIDLHFDDVRAMFAIPPHEYRQKSDLRKWVIDAPIREINEADIGLHLTVDYERHRRGRQLLGVRILAKLTKRAEPKDVTPATKAELEEADLLAAHPERYAEILREVEASPPLPGIHLDPETEALRRLAAEVAAAKPKRGRPRKPTSSRG